MPTKDPLKRKAIQAKYNATDKRKQQRRAWREKHREHVTAYDAAYRQRPGYKEKHRAYDTLYRQRSGYKEKMQAYLAEYLPAWRLAHPPKLRRSWGKARKPRYLGPTLLWNLGETWPFLTEEQGPPSDNLLTKLTDLLTAKWNDHAK